MPAYSVRFLVEFVVTEEDVDGALSEITDGIRDMYDVTSVAYGDLTVTDPNAEPRGLDEEDDE